LKYISLFYFKKNYNRLLYNFSDMQRFKIFLINNINNSLNKCNNNNNNKMKKIMILWWINFLIENILKINNHKNNNLKICKICKKKISISIENLYKTASGLIVPKQFILKQFKTRKNNNLKWNFIIKNLNLKTQDRLKIII